MEHEIWDIICIFLAIVVPNENGKTENVRKMGAINSPYDVYL